MRCFTPLLSHKIFYHNYFLNIYYFILFNGWDWELLFSTLNLNQPMLLYQLQYLDLNPAIITLKIYIFSLITIEHLINFFFSSIIFVLIYFSIIFVFKKKKKTWTLIGTQVDSISRSRNEGVTQRWGFWSQAFSSLTLFAEQLYSPSLASIFEHVLLDSSRQVLTWI